MTHLHPCSALLSSNRFARLDLFSNEAIKISNLKTRCGSFIGALAGKTPVTIGLSKKTQITHKAHLLLGPLAFTQPLFKYSSSSVHTAAKQNLLMCAELRSLKYR